MAGTRLWIIVGSLVFLLGLLAASILLGLCAQPNDVLCRPWFQQQGRQWLGSAQATTQFQETQNLLSQHKVASQSPVTVAVLEHHAVSWSQPEVLQQLTKQMEEDAWKVVVPLTHHMRSVCDHPEASEYTMMADVWICEYSEQRDSSPPPFSTSAAAAAGRAVIIAQSRLVLYSASATTVAQVKALQQVYPNSFHRIPKPWRIRMVTDRKDWQEIVPHVSTVIQDALDNGPLFGVVGPPDVQVLFRNLTRHSILVTPNAPSSKEANDTTSSDSFEARQRLLNIDALWDSFSTPEDATTIHLILPQDPMEFVQLDHPSRSSLMAQRGDTSWAVLVEVSSTSSEEDDLDTLHESLQQAFWTSLDYVWQYVFSIPPSLRDGTFEIQTDGTLPTLYVTLWHQRALHQATESLLRQAQLERTLVTNLPYRVAVTEEVASLWRTALQSAEDVPHLWAQHQYARALQRLSHGLTLLDDLSTNPHLLEPLTFPWDQLAAIFAPLLVPLLLPILTGLVREVKRYKKLQRQRHQPLNHGKNDDTEGETTVLA